MGICFDDEYPFYNVTNFNLCNPFLMNYIRKSILAISFKALVTAFTPLIAFALKITHYF